VNNRQTAAFKICFAAAPVHSSALLYSVQASDRQTELLHFCKPHNFEFIWKIAWSGLLKVSNEE